MEIDRQEAIHNLRITVKSILLVSTQPEYRAWAKGYLAQTKPAIDIGILADWAEDAIVELAGWQPWESMGRERDYWFAIRSLGAALDRFAAGDYYSATIFARAAIIGCNEIAIKSQGVIAGFVQSLEVSLFGEAVTK